MVLKQVKYDSSFYLNLTCCIFDSAELGSVVATREKCIEFRAHEISIGALDFWEKSLFRQSRVLI